ncbi:MAG: tetratricopeptide repeat protein [Planctomycetes bacterium]|nr:tetratricopeptide repeat protein [Planctomycetota bacterium]
MKTSAKRELSRSEFPTRRQWMMLLALLVFAVTTRWVMVGEFQRSNPEATAPGGDARVYWETAERIAHGRWVDDKPFLTVPFYGYALGIIRATGAGLRTVYFLQAFLHVATAFLIGHLASRKFHRSVGILAVALFLLLEEPAFLITRLLPSTVQLFLVACVLFAAGRYSCQRGARDAGFLGACVGMLALAYPPAMVILPVAVIWIVGGKPLSDEPLRSKMSLVRPAWAQGAIALAAGAVVIAPATLHNWLAVGEFIPVTAHAGITLRHGNAPGADGLYTPVEGVSTFRKKMHGDMARVFEREVGRRGTYREIDAHFRGKAIRYMVDDPLRSAGLVMRKLYWFATGRHCSDIYYPTLERADGLARTLFLAPVPTAWLMGPAFVGLWLAGWRKKVNLVEWAMLFVPAGIVAVFWYTPRYRLPVIPMLIIGAAWALGVAIGNLRERERQWRVPAVIAAAFGVAVVLGFVNAGSGFDRREAYRPQYEYNRGHAFVRLGEYGKAVDRFTASDKLAPNRKMVLGAMVEAHTRLGRFVEGEAACRRLIDMDPSDPAGWIALGGLRFAMRRFAEADRAFSDVLATDSENADAHLGLWLVRSHAGRPDAGIDHLRLALRFDPSNLMAAAEYGLYLAERGQLVEAEEVWRRSLSLAPKQSVVCYNLANLLLDTGRISEALPFLEQAVRIDPSYDKARDRIRAVLEGRHGTQAGPP